MTSVKEEIQLRPTSSRPQCDEGAATLDPSVSKQRTGLPPPAEENAIDEVTEDSSTVLDPRALWSLLAQHLSSSWGQRCYEFAS